MSRPVFPNLVVGRRDVSEDEPWRVRAGLAQRGAASCNFADRVLTVPLDDSEAARVVRAHELTHLRLSPASRAWTALPGDISERALECAEELRVNTVVARLNFDVAHLRDGSERLAGERLAEQDNWAEAVYFYAALHGTGAAKEFMAGVRKHRPTWAKALRSFGATLSRTLDQLSMVKMTSTQLLGTETLPAGYVEVTLPLARLADRLAGAQAPTSDESLQRLRRSLTPGARRPPAGRFAELVFDTSLDYEAVRPRVGGRRRTPSLVGTGAPRLDRLLRDPQQRIFSRTHRSAGAVVVIDQSGSMDIAQESLEQLLQAVPGVTVIGYSHRPGDISGSPNAWLLADRGRRALSWPVGNVGNGVDGPALEWALSRRSPGDRVVWVTDGQVTDANDHPDDELTARCADLVMRHQVVLVRSIEEVPDGLRRGGLTALHSAEFGRIGRKMGSLT